MKKITLLAVCMIISSLSFLNAQTNQGNILMGVSSTLSLAGTGSDLIGIGFASQKYKSDADGFEESESDKTTSINLLPKAGYFVADNLAIGLDLNLAISIQKYGFDDDKYTRRLLSAGPFVRYYVPTSKAKPFIELNSAFGTITQKYEFDTFSEEGKTNVMSLGGGIGIAAPLGDKVTLDVLAGYTSLTVKDKEDNEDNYRTVIGTLGLKIGFTVFLGSN